MHHTVTINVFRLINSITVSNYDGNFCELKFKVNSIKTEESLDEADSVSSMRNALLMSRQGAGTMLLW
jgi:hypothetical protein